MVKNIESLVGDSSDDNSGAINLVRINAMKNPLFQKTIDRLKTNKEKQEFLALFDNYVQGAYKNDPRLRRLMKSHHLANRASYLPDDENSDARDTLIGQNYSEPGRTYHYAHNFIGKEKSKKGILQNIYQTIGGLTRAILPGAAGFGAVYGANYWKKGFDEKALKFATQKSMRKAAMNEVITADRDAAILAMGEEKAAGMIARGAEREAAKVAAEKMAEKGSGALLDAGREAYVAAETASWWKKPFLYMAGGQYNQAAGQAAMGEAMINSGKTVARESVNAAEIAAETVANSGTILANEAGYAAATGSEALAGVAEVAASPLERMVLPVVSTTIGAVTKPALYLLGGYLLYRTIKYFVKKRREKMDLHQLDEMQALQRGVGVQNEIFHRMAA
jgi:hypothetical protein